MRNFEDLSDHDFEMLIRDLMRAELGIRFEAFSRGPDGGVDLRGEDPTGIIIIQCKHYRRSRPHDLKRAAAHEASLLAAQPPSRYILATTASMTPALKSELVEILSPHVKSNSDILGPEDIDGLLTLHPSIEKATPKLWMTSGVVLQRLLASATVNRTSLAVDRMQETMKVYVPTPSLLEGRSALANEMCCLIQGPAGIGKTTLAYVLAAEAMVEGYQPIFISTDVDEALSLVTEGSDRYVVVYDDFLGQSTMAELLGKNEDARLADLVQLAVTSGRVRLIATTRDYILRHALSKYDRLEETIARSHSIVVTLRDFEPLTRAHILYNHLYYSSLPDRVLQSFQDTDRVLEIIQHENYNPRLVAGFSSLPAAHGPTNDGPSLLLSSLNDPIQLWGSVLNQLQPECRDILAVLLTFSSALDANALAVATRSFRRQKGHTLDTLEFVNALRALEPTFLMIEGGYSRRAEGSSFVGFANPSIRDFVLLLLGDLLEQEVIDLLNSTVYWEQVAIFCGLAFESANESSMAAWSMARPVRSQVLKGGLGFLASETEPFARAISRTLFVPSPRSPFRMHDQGLADRIKLFMTWPLEIQERVVYGDPNLGEQIRGNFALFDEESYEKSIRELLDKLSRQEGDLQVKLLEPTLRDAASKSLGIAEACADNPPLDESWWKDSASEEAVSALIVAARITRLLEFDDLFHDRVTNAATRVAERLLTEIQTVVGYTVAAAKLVRGPRSEEETDPQNLRQDLEYLYDHDDHGRHGGGSSVREVVLELNRVFGAISAEAIVDNRIPYLPSPDRLEVAIRDVRALQPLVADVPFENYADTLKAAMAIVHAGKLSSRLIEEIRTAQEPPYESYEPTTDAPYGSYEPTTDAPRDQESDLKSQVRHMFRQLGEAAD